MKIKKLEWGHIDNKNRILVSKNKLYSINVLPDGKVIVSSSFQSAFYSENIEQAQEACQKHYEQFILSQIENEVKPPNSLENDFGVKLISQFLGDKV